MLPERVKFRTKRPNWGGSIQELRKKDPDLPKGGVKREGTTLEGKAGRSRRTENVLREDPLEERKRGTNRPLPEETGKRCKTRASWSVLHHRIEALGKR